MEEIIIRDLNKRVSRKCINGKNPNLWRAIPYQSESFEGVMLACGGGTNPVPITIQLAVKGLYRIWLGIYYSQIRVRLSKDSYYQKITLPEKRSIESSAFLYEVFWKETDLTEQDLILGGNHDPDSYPGALAYIRLEPISKIQKRLKRKCSFPLFITDDGYSIFGEFPHSHPEDLLEHFENIPEESCMRGLIWGSGNADICNYPTKVGNFYPYYDDYNNYLRHFHRIFYRNMKLWREKGWDSLKLMREYTKKRKWEFHIYIRVEAFAAQFPHDGTIHSNFFCNHPEYYCLDLKGQHIGRLSYAYPEVQEHMLNLISEIAKYRPDGICLAFIRGMPMVLYEPIMIEGFKKKHRIDPRELEEDNPRWLKYKAQVITSFLKKVKTILEKSQRLSVIVPGNEHDCKRWGLDISFWVREGIVNDVFPVGQRFNKHDVHFDDPDNLNFRYFMQLKGRKKIRLIPMLYPWDKFRKDYSGWRQLMYSFLAQGADAYGVWDGANINVFPRIGDIGYKERKNFMPPKTEFRKIKLLSMKGFRMDRYHYFEVV